MALWYLVGLRALRVWGNVGVVGRGAEEKQVLCPSQPPVPFLEPQGTAIIHSSYLPHNPQI